MLGKLLPKRGVNLQQVQTVVWTIVYSFFLNHPVQNYANRDSQDRAYDFQLVASIKMQQQNHGHS